MVRVSGCSSMRCLQRHGLGKYAAPLAHSILCLCHASPASNIARARPPLVLLLLLLLLLLQNSDGLHPATHPSSHWEPHCPSDPVSERGTIRVTLILIKGRLQCPQRNRKLAEACRNVEFGQPYSQNERFSICNNAQRPACSLSESSRDMLGRWRISAHSQPRV